METEFVNNIVINNKNTLYKELKVKHLKVIYKCLLGDEPDPFIVQNNINNILSNITSLTLPDIEDLNFVDYFLLLFELRCTSIGNIISAELPDTSNYKLQINIYKFTETLLNFKVNELLASDSIDNIKIYYRLPTLLEVSKLIENNTVEDIYTTLLDKIVIKDTEINLKNLDKKSIITILENLPAKTTYTIASKAYTVLEKFNEINLLSHIPEIADRCLYFNFNIKNLILLLKLLFGDQLLSLYENIFALCKMGNFTPEYIENCTPGEYLLFYKKLEQIRSQQTTPNQSSNLNINTNSNFDDINPYNSSDLPPITSRSEFTP
jgi:hypothetical protein